MGRTLRWIGDARGRFFVSHITLVYEHIEHVRVRTWNWVDKHECVNRISGQSPRRIRTRRQLMG